MIIYKVSISNGAQAKVIIKYIFININLKCVSWLLFLPLVRFEIKLNFDFVVDFFFLVFMLITWGKNTFFYSLVTIFFAVTNAGLEWLEPCHKGDSVVCVEIEGQLVTFENPCHLYAFNSHHDSGKLTWVRNYKLSSPWTHIALTLILHHGKLTYVTFQLRE